MTVEKDKLLAAPPALLDHPPKTASVNREGSLSPTLQGPLRSFDTTIVLPLAPLLLKTTEGNGKDLAHSKALRAVLMFLETVRLAFHVATKHLVLFWQAGNNPAHQLPAHHPAHHPVRPRDEADFHSLLADRQAQANVDPAALSTMRQGASGVLRFLPDERRFS